jgi:mRNA interferase RelE/StbE
MNYSVRFPSESIERKFQKVLESVSPKKLREDIMTSVEALAGNPRPFGEPKLKPPLFVYGLTAQYRIRIRNYRVLYDVDDKSRVVWVLDLRKRNEKTYQ